MDVYQYNRAESLLKDLHLKKKEGDPKFSLRGWSRELGMKTHTPLQLMLASKRPIPKKYIPGFRQTLNMSEDEITYLEALIDFQRAKKDQVKKEALERVVEIKSEKTDKSGEVCKEELLSEHQVAL